MLNKIDTMLHMKYSIFALYFPAKINWLHNVNLGKIREFARYFLQLLHISQLLREYNIKSIQLYKNFQMSNRPSDHFWQQVL
jgi:hypothetical protein